VQHGVRLAPPLRRRLDVIDIPAVAAVTFTARSKGARHRHEQLERAVAARDQGVSPKRLGRSLH